ncbi:MAG TPA: thioesterase family protein [Ktedonobacterales bacterium]|nr:thioesterase family protein [Ktedonobacterales bacterium]
MPDTPQASVRIRVPFVDVDSSQRIHFTAFFRYIEVAEHELMRAIGMPYSSALFEYAFPRVHLECDFKRAIRYDDQLDITARIERVGDSSWTVAFTGNRVESSDQTGSGAVVATGRMTIVSMDPATERAAPIPDRLRRALLGEYVAGGSSRA